MPNETRPDNFPPAHLCIQQVQDSLYCYALQLHAAGLTRGVITEILEDVLRDIICIGVAGPAFA